MRNANNSKSFLYISFANSIPNCNNEKICSSHPFFFPIATQQSLHSSSSLEFMSNGWLMVLFWHIFQSFSQIVLLCKKEDWTQPGGNCFGMQRQALLSLSVIIHSSKFQSLCLMKWTSQMLQIFYIFRIWKL